MSVNGRGAGYVRPMPSRHRAAASSLVTVRPAKRISPAPGDRSPEMRPNMLVLPAPFGPTIPTVSPGPTANERSSATTTRPNLFVTWSSSSSGLAIRLLVRRLEGPGERYVWHQRIVDDLHGPAPLGARLPLHAHAGGVDDTRSRVLARGPVELSSQSLDVHLEQRVGHLGLVVRVADRGERRVGDLEEAVVAERLHPLLAGGRLEFVGDLRAGLPGQRGLPRHPGRPPRVGGDVVDQAPPRLHVGR